MFKTDVFTGTITRDSSRREMRFRASLINYNLPVTLYYCMRNNLHCISLISLNLNNVSDTDLKVIIIVVWLKKRCKMFGDAWQVWNLSCQLVINSSQSSKEIIRWASSSIHLHTDNIGTIMIQSLVNMAFNYLAVAVWTINPLYQEFQVLIVEMEGVWILWERYLQIM